MTPARQDAKHAQNERHPRHAARRQRAVLVLEAPHLVEDNHAHADAGLHKHGVSKGGGKEVRTEGNKSEANAFLLSAC